MGIDGFAGETIRPRALAGGVAVGGAAAVVIAAVVDVVVVGAGTDEQTEVAPPVDVRIAEDADTIADQAATVEGVVAVVAVGGRGIVAPAQGVGGFLRPPGQAVGKHGAGLDLQVVVGFEGECTQLAAGKQQGGGQSTQGSGKAGCCYCHSGLHVGLRDGARGAGTIGRRLAGFYRLLGLGREREKSVEFWAAAVEGACLLGLAICCLQAWR
ncbi:hypothetical protein D3C84_578670 [compost metagenome]